MLLHQILLQESQKKIKLEVRPLWSSCYGVTLTSSGIKIESIETTPKGTGKSSHSMYRCACLNYIVPLCRREKLWQCWIKNTYQKDFHASESWCGLEARCVFSRRHYSFIADRLARRSPRSSPHSQEYLVNPFSILAIGRASKMTKDANSVFGIIEVPCMVYINRRFCVLRLPVIYLRSIMVFFSKLNLTIRVSVFRLIASTTPAVMATWRTARKNLQPRQRDSYLVSVIGAIENGVKHDLGTRQLRQEPRLTLDLYLLCKAD